MKKTEITKVEIACLKGMLQENIPVATMAKQLNRSASSLNKQISSIKVSLIWYPKWNKDMMSEEAKLALDIF